MAIFTLYMYRTSTKFTGITAHSEYSIKIILDDFPLGLENSFNYSALAKTIGVKVLSNQYYSENCF